MVEESRSSKQELLVAAEAAVSETRGETAAGGPGPARSRPRLLISGATLIALLGTYVSVLRPEWVFPAEPVAESPQISEASMRLALVRERQRVEEYLRTHGRLPASLFEAGGRLPDATLSPGSANSFTVSVPHAGQLLELRSSDRLEDFLGNSLEIILSRGKDP